MRSLKRLILERVPSRHLAIATIALLGACDHDFLGPDGSCLLCITGMPPVSFAVSPDSANILLQDTVTLSAWSCENGGCIFSHDPVVSSWSIIGDAVVPTRTPIPATSDLLLRGSVPGESMVTAVAKHDDTKRQTVRITVADSSAIASITLHTCCQGKDTIVAYGNVISSLLDEAGRRYRARPTQWTLSDSSMITLGDSSIFGSGSRTVRVHKAGIVEIRAAFRNVESRLQVFVRP